MIPLIQLKPQFIQYETNIETWTVVDGDPETWRARGMPTKSKTGPRTTRRFVSNILEAQGILFLCPKCFMGNERADRAAGCHQCEVTFANKGVADGQGTGNKGKSVYWNVSGNGFADLSTTPSILLIGGCGWHGYITNGVVTII